MKPQDILNSMDKIDENHIENARRPKKHNIAMWIAVGAVAACLIFVLVSPLKSIFKEVDYSEPTADIDLEFSREILIETAPLMEDVWIYYVEKDEIKKISIFLTVDPKVVFDMWKDQNWIGEEVKLIDVHIDSNATTSVSEFMGEGVATHTPGDYFILNITVY